MKQNLFSADQDKRTSSGVMKDTASESSSDIDSLLERVSLLQEVEIAEMNETDVYSWSQDGEKNSFADIANQEIIFNCPEPKKGFYAVPPGAGKNKTRMENE